MLWLSEQALVNGSGLQVVEAGTGLQVQIRMFRVGDQQAAPFQYPHDAPPLGVQGPLADDVVADLFGDWVRELKYFWFRETDLDGIPNLLARSGRLTEAVYSPRLERNIAVGMVSTDILDDQEGLDADLGDGRRGVKVGALPFC